MKHYPLIFALNYAILFMKEKSMELKDRIKFIRESEELGAAQLADKLGVSRTTMFRYENGESIPPHSVIKNFCHMFNINPKWLETGEGSIYDYGDENIYDLVENIIKGNSKFARKVFSGLSKLSDEDWNCLEKIYYKIVN